MNSCAGALLIAMESGRLLLLLRNEHGPTWANVGGGMEPGEGEEDCVRRELREETSYRGPIRLIPSYLFDRPKLRYANYIGIVPREFTPALNDEHLEYRWVSLREFFAMRSGWHFGLKLLVQQDHRRIIRAVECCFLRRSRGIPS